MYLGDYSEDYATLNVKFLTAAAAKVPTTLTGTDGVTLATAQALYAPSKVDDAMDLVADSVDAAALKADDDYSVSTKEVTIP